MAKKNILFTVNGYDILENTIYTVTDKIDYSAPAGFIEFGVSKVPGTGDTACCPYNLTSMAYDHGFSELCPMYQNEDIKVVRTKVKTLISSVLTPFCRRNSKREEELYSVNESPFWDSYIVGFNEDSKFNTGDPTQAFNLYIAILSGKLSPKGEENKPKYADSAYLVDSIEIRTKRHSTAIINKQTAVFNFMTLSKDITKAKAILMYSGINAEYTTDQESLSILFEDRIVTKPEKIKEFNDNVDFFNESDENELQIYLYRHLTNLKKDNKSKLVVSKTGISYNDVEIGKDIMSASKKLAKQESKEISDIVAEIINNND